MMMVGVGAFATGEQEEAATGMGEGPLEITIMTNYGGAEPPGDDNPAELIIEEYTNTELDMQWYTGGVYEQEILPPKFASGDLTDVVGFGGSIRLSYMLSAFQDGVFWDLTERIKDYPNLSKLGEIRFKNASVDGRLYGVPRARPLVRRTFVYRRDWAEALDVPEPTNVEQFYEMARAFTYDDPDGNGEDDTYGFFMVDGNEGHFGTIFGAPTNWAYIDGEMVKSQTTIEYMQALKYMRRMYEDGFMHAEYPIMRRNNDAIEAFAEGRAGIMRYNVSSISSQAARTRAIDEDADVWAFSVVAGPNGTFTIGERGYNGVLGVTTDNVESEEHLDGILTFIDAMGDEEMASLMIWGIEGEHYEMENGLATPINDPAVRENFNQTIKFPYRWCIIANWPEFYAKPGNAGPIYDLANELWGEMEKYAVSDPTEPLFSETHAERGSDLDQILDDAQKQFITGRISENEYWDAVDRWRAAGGDQMAAEFADAYRANQ
jgi:putative aldouronate transport system substrate-binding protein